MYFKRLLPLALAATASAQTLLAALAAQNSSLSILNGLLGTQPALVAALGSATNITILAPNDAALTKLLSTPAGQQAATKPDLVAAILSYHVLQGTYGASAFKTTPQFFHTLLTNTSYTNVTGGQVVEGIVNGTQVEIISGLLQVSIVTQADITFTGGVIHIIDTVLTIPTSDAGTAIAAGLTSLASAANATGLIPVLEGTKDITIFAPTNAAFAAIANVTATLNATQIAGILAYHVVAGTVGYSSILTNTTLVTLAGSSLTITVTSGGVLVNSAHVVIANVLVQNGVVHVIDAVLSPPVAAASTTSSVPTSTAARTSTSAPAFTGAANALQPGAMGLAALFGAGAAMVNNL